jgi:hypothetical protein
MVYDSLPYNSAVEMPHDGEAVVCTGRRCFIPRVSSGCIINPKDRPLFGFKTCDPNTYDVYFVHTAPIRGAWGDSILYADPTVAGIQERIFLGCQYTVSVFDAQAFIESELLSDDYAVYDRDYFINKIRPFFCDTVKAHMAEALVKWGLSALQVHLPEIGKAVEESLNETRFLPLGLKLSELSLTYSEDEVHRDMRETTQRDAYMAQHAETVKQYMKED